MQKIAAFMKPVHPIAYRRRDGEHPEITGVYHLIPESDLPSRLCYEVTYRDGAVDYVPLSGVKEGHWEIVSTAK